MKTIMKKQIMFCILFALGAGMFLGCNDSEASGLFKGPPSKAVTLLFDNTSPMLAKPTAQEITRLYAFSNNDIYNGYSLRVRRLSTVNLTEVSDQTIPAEPMLTAEQLKRVALIKHFRKNIIATIDSLTKEKIRDEGSSVIYRTIAQELNHLAQGKTSLKIALIYSDLTENSSDANFYAKSSITELKTRPQKVIDRLQRAEPLHDLKGVKVYFVFRPKTYAEEERFNAIVSMYKMMLEAKGAQVIVGANLVTE